MTRCKKCGEPINWIITPAGKKMPTNPGAVTVCTPEGKVVQGFVPHWDPCPYADESREKVKSEQRSQATNPLHLPV